jgi:hypothetical protein
MTKTPEIVTTFDSTPVVGERVTYRTVGPWFTATGSGIYDGVRPSEHDGALCHFLRDGEINGTPQRLHGFPVDQVV